jgi:hypothetical protein
MRTLCEELETTWTQLPPLLTCHYITAKTNFNEEAEGQAWTHSSRMDEQDEQDP